MPFSAKIVSLWFLLLASVKAGDYAPAFTLPATDGRNYSLEACRGKLVYLTFVEQSCYPCRMEVPVINQVSAREKDNLAVLGVIGKARTLEEARAAQEFLGVKFPLLYDPAGKILAAYQVLSVPQGFLISERGAVISRYNGFAEQIFSADLSRETERIRRLRDNCAVYVSPLVNLTDPAAAEKLGEAYAAGASSCLERSGYRIAKSKVGTRFIINGSVAKKEGAIVTLYLDDMLYGKTVAVAEAPVPPNEFNRMVSAIEREIYRRCPIKPEPPAPKK